MHLLKYGSNQWDKLSFLAEQLRYFLKPFKTAYVANMVVVYCDRVFLLLLRMA